MRKRVIIVTALIIVSIITFIIYRNSKQEERNTENSGVVYKILLSKRYPETYKGDDLYSDKVELDKLLNGTEFNEIFISDSDIDMYDWDNQEILLNKSASDAIIERSSDEIKYEEKLFIVTLNDERIFGGTIISEWSARKVDYPVIYITYDDTTDRIILVIRPIHDVRASSFEETESPYKSVIESEEIKEFFLEIDKLK